jgi:hypothetical protein
VARYASRDDEEPAAVVEWEGWAPSSAARDHARSRGHDFNEG